MLQFQRKVNRRSRERWGDFASHRHALTTSILTHAGPSAKSLCLLGAGNCNDVDLELLASRFEEIHLVDLDEKALLFAKQRASIETRKKLRLHDRVDLSGTIDRLARWQGLAVNEYEVASHASTHARTLSGLLGRFDCVVSTCLLSQLHLALIRQLGPRHALYSLAARVTTKTHLRILESLTALGGTALLVTELTSNEFVVPSLWAELQGQFQTDQGGVIQTYAFNGMLQQHLSKLTREQLAFGPCTPRAVAAIVSEDPDLNRTLQNTAPDLMWLWQQEPERQALVYTLPVVRHGPVPIRKAQFGTPRFEC